MASHWMIYGANGYTGRLVAEQAQREGLTPLLGGRNPAACTPSAASSGWSAGSSTWGIRRPAAKPWTR